VISRVQEETKAMKCVICKQGATRPGTTTLVLERGGLTFVLKNVPAEVCDNCGEEYVAEDAASAALTAAERAAEEVVTVEIREFKAA
jgi:YgiT-type zinc finger domain-containing protein